MAWKKDSVFAKNKLIFGTSDAKNTKFFGVQKDKKALDFCRQKRDNAAAPRGKPQGAPPQSRAAPPPDSDRHTPPAPDTATRAASAGGRPGYLQPPALGRHGAGGGQRRPPRQRQSPPDRPDGERGKQREEESRGWQPQHARPRSARRERGRNPPDEGQVGTWPKRAKRVAESPQK